MQRYHPASCTGAVNSSAIGGPSARDTVRADSSSLPANFSLNSRRPAPLTPYKLKCEKEGLNTRLGPPDFHPQTPNCPEENLTREYVQSGYRETVEGLEEAREILLTQVQAFSKHLVVKCKDAIRKRLRAINDSRAQKRKAGQVYGVPLSGSLLTKPGVFPEQRPCGEDFRKKWIEGLSQQHKRLRSLADNVPHGYRKRSLFEVLIRNNVPLLRATWFIKTTYLNQVRPNSASISCGAFDKAQSSRTDIWTKDVVDYLQCLVDEFFSRGNSHLTMPNKDQSSQMFTVGFSHTKGDPPSGFFDGEEPSLHFKWWYVVRLLLWHQAEGLLLPSLIVDWVLGQLEENDVLEILELLLPIIYGVLETIVLSQTYVRTLVRISVRFIRDSFPGGSDLVDNSRRAYTTSALVEMLRYLILAVPDTFVALDCFPFPPCVVSHTVNDGNFVSKIPEDAAKLRFSSAEVAGSFRSKTIDFQYQSSAFDNVVSSIRKCAGNLSKAVSPGFPVCSVAKAVNALDRSLLNGDIGVAYRYLFEDYCNGSIYEGWFEEVSPCLRMSLKWIQTINVAFVCSVFFLCEWATCDFRDFLSAAPQEIEFSGGKDFSQVYIATRLLKMKAIDLQSLSGRKYENSSGLNATIAKGSSQQNSLFGRNSVGSVFEPKRRSRKLGGSNGSVDLFESPGPLHDILVCWIDQHEVQKGEGFKRLQLLIVELIRAGIFYPHSYVRQLIVSGIMDMNGPAVDPDKRKRHHQILKHLPGSFMHAILDDGKIAQGPQLLEVMNVYSKERRLVLQGLFCEQHSDISYANKPSNQKRKCCPTSVTVISSSTSVNQLKSIQSSSNVISSKSVKNEADIEELKESISLLLRLPNNSSIITDTSADEPIGSAKKSFVSIYSKFDIAEATPGCEDCRRAKKQKVSDERNLYLHGCSPIPSDDEDMWWVKKGPKSSEALKVDPPVKTSKQVSKGRRKTQSLAHLAASRIEGSQGASTSHVCDNRVTCPHHRSGMEGEPTRPVDGTKINHGRDIVSIGQVLKRLRLTEKRAISGWLMTVIRHAVEETEKTVSKAVQLGRSLTSVDDRNAIRWKLGEDQLSAILYLSDVCNDFVSGVKFLLWVLPKIFISSNSTINNRRSILHLQKNVENQVCEVSEAYLLSALRRYENILVATDLISEALSVIVHRVTSIMTSNGRVSGSAALVYARYLLKKYSSMASVIEWEKNFKATYDKRLIAELDPGCSLDGELGPLGVPAGVEDLDDFFRQKIGGGRLSRVGMNMREVVQRQFEEALHYSFGKDRKVSSGGTPKGLGTEKPDEGHQIAQKIISGLMECIRHTGGAAQEGDPSLVSSAVSAIVGNLGTTVAKTADFIPGGSSNFASASGSLDFARRIICIHVTCLCLLKEALGERQSRVFEIALATEAFSVLAGVYPPGKASRTQFQSLADPHDSNSNVFGENTKVIVGRATKFAAAISALVIGAVIQGVCSLERLVTLFRFKEGLDFVQFVRTTRSNANGNTRALGMHKIENSIEDYVHWFRLLVGNCRTVFDGLIVELLGEPSIVALFRMQRLLPLSLVLPPAYSIFSFVLWRPFILNSTVTAREDINQLSQSLTMAIGDIVRHLPFRDVCLRDTQGFYNHLMTDSSDVEFAAILELNGSDLPFKSMAFVPLRARLFLNAIIDCKLPSSMYNQDDGSRTSGIGDGKVQYSESKMKLLDRLVHVLDTLQPAKFHWQWVELRLLLNEQALIEKLETRDMSLADAVRLPSPSPEKAAAASDNEKNFIEIILTRLLVRPDAASLFSDVIHLFGRSLEDSMLLQAKWFLGGQDVLFGRKSIRQRLTNIAESKGLSTKAQFWKPWGWFNSGLDCTLSKGDKKSELLYLEEGEVVEEGTDSRKCGHKSAQILENEVVHASQQHVTERALIELVLPCIDQSSDGSRNTFANDLIKQMNNIEQQINAVTSGSGKQTGSIPSGIEGPAIKGSNRKMKNSSPGLPRRSTSSTSTDPPLPSPAALRASMSLRIQLILRLLPVILEDREPSGRNMRHMLASVILHLLGNRLVHEDANLTFCPTHTSLIKKETELPSEASLAAFSDLPGESLFGRMLLILHALLSSCQPSWLSSKSSSKSMNETSKDSAGPVRELAESLQNELECMQLPDMIRWRIQAAMPIPLPSGRCFLSCQPPTIPLSALSSFQPSTSTPGPLSGNLSMPQGSKISSPRVVTAVPGKSKPLPPQQDYDTEIDPWLLLEDGAGSGQSSSNAAITGGGEHANFRASYWLKGAVRVRRTDLTYIGAMDDDS